MGRDAGVRSYLMKQEKHLPKSMLLFCFYELAECIQLTTVWSVKHISLNGTSIKSFSFKDVSVDDKQEVSQNSMLLIICIV